MSTNNVFRLKALSARLLLMQDPSELVAVFRANGRKVTPQRQCIFGVLYGDRTHPTAEAVYEAARRQMDTISLKTVYQTLHELVALGEVAALDLGTGTTRFDPNVTEGHHHLVCRSCGKVRDLHADFSGVRVPAGDDGGFEVGAAEVIFRGRCAACRDSRLLATSVQVPDASGALGATAVGTTVSSTMEVSGVSLHRPMEYRSAPRSTNDNEEEPTSWLN